MTCTGSVSRAVRSRLACEQRSEARVVADDARRLSQVPVAALDEPGCEKVAS